MRSVSIKQVAIIDDGAEVLSVDVAEQVVDDDATARALGVSDGPVRIRRVLLPRTAYVALLAALKRPDGDDWPDAVLPHPITKSAKAG